MVRNIVYSADGGSITNVIVDGQVVVRDRHASRVDEGKLLDEACEAGLTIARRRKRESTAVKRTAAGTGGHARRRAW
jgi:hypothetical protein